jgi:hypothetical protein
LWSAPGASTKLDALFFVAADGPPTAAVTDDDLYLAVQTAVLDFYGKVEAIDIILTIEYAKAVIAPLSTAC